MASSSSLSHLLLPFKFPSIPIPSSPRNSLNFPSFPSTKPSNYLKQRRNPFTKIPFALAESDSPKSLEPDAQILLQEVADKFVLSADYFSQMPRDLRLDLNDAAFDLSNGPVKVECGEELGEALLNISRAWESADSSTSAALMSKLPVLLDSLSNSNKSALGRRLVSAGRRFQSMGQYGQGEPEMIAKSMIRVGKYLSATAVPEVTDVEEKQETRTFKFGELQVELTSEKAYIGAIIGFVFGVLSWEVSQGVQNSSLQYANDNALLLAKPLRGALLALFYTSTILSGFATLGLILLGSQLKSKGK